MVLPCGFSCCLCVCFMHLCFASSSGPVELWWPVKHRRSRTSFARQGEAWRKGTNWTTLNDELFCEVPTSMWITALACVVMTPHSCINHGWCWRTATRMLSFAAFVLQCLCRWNYVMLKVLWCERVGWREQTAAVQNKTGYLCVCVVQVRMLLFLVSFREPDKAALLQGSGYTMQSPQRFKSELWPSATAGNAENVPPSSLSFQLVLLVRSFRSGEPSSVLMPSVLCSSLLGASGNSVALQGVCRPGGLSFSSARAEVDLKAF